MVTVNMQLKNPEELVIEYMSQSLAALEKHIIKTTKFSFS